jgi:probable blue pigment (indigoidine) exporter
MLTVASRGVFVARRLYAQGPGLTNTSWCSRERWTISEVFGVRSPVCELDCETRRNGGNRNRAGVPMNDAIRLTSSGTKWEGIGYLLLTSFLWGVNWPLMKFLVSELPPLSARAIAGVIAAAVTFAVAAIRGETLIPPTNQWQRLLTAAALNYTAWMALTTVSLIWLYASETVIISYTLPIWTALLARPLLGERLTFASGFGMTVGLSGVILLVLVQPAGGGWTKLLGAAFALSGSALFGLGAVLSKRAPLLMPPVAAVSWQIGLGTIPLLLAMFVERPSLTAIDVRGWLGLTASGVVALGVGYVAWFAALQRLPASLATIGSLLVPVVGVLGSAFALGEPLGLRECSALALTLGGIVIASR